MTIVYEFLTVTVVLSSFLGLGKSLSKILKLQESTIPLDGLLGAGVYAFSISILGHFFSLFEVTTVLIISGLVFFTFCLHKRWFNFQLSLPWVVVLYLIFAFVIAFYPSTYFDPLNYHLYGIVEWSKLDRLSHIQSAIQIMHNSYADYLYFPFSFWWGQAKIDDLISVQVSSQVFTVILGITSFSFLFYELLRDKVEKIWIPLFIMAALTRASLQHKGFIAKNDWIALSWFLGSAYIFLKCQGNRLIIIILSSFLMGLSIGTKLTYLVPASVFYGWQLLRKKIKIDGKAIILIFLIFLTLVPYLLRNYFWTGNPVFPLAYKIFPTNFLGPSWLEGFKYFDMNINQVSLELLKNKATRIFTYEPIAYFSLFIPFFYRKLSFSIRVLTILVSSFLLVFIFLFGPGSELRHFGPLAISINLFGVLGVILILDKFIFSKNHQIIFSNLFLLIICLNFLKLENQLNPIPSTLRKGVFYPRVRALMDENKGFKASAYLALNSKENFKIGLIDDTPPYYLSIHKVIRLWDDPNFDRSLKSCSELRCVVNVLKKENINYLLESGFVFDPYYNLLVVSLIDKIVLTYPEVVVWKDKDEKLISVKILSEVINRNEF